MGSYQPPPRWAIFEPRLVIEWRRLIARILTGWLIYILIARLMYLYIFEGRYHLVRGAGALARRRGVVRKCAD
jgi:hypothetical protein